MKKYFLSLIAGLILVFDSLKKYKEVDLEIREDKRKQFVMVYYPL